MLEGSGRSLAAARFAWYQYTQLQYQRSVERYKDTQPPYQTACSTSLVPDSARSTELISVRGLREAP
eukprot:3685852-Rhodomonas_salina.2